MFSFGSAKGLKVPRGIIWITRWAPWTVHAQEDCDDQDVVGDNGYVCALCCPKSLATLAYPCVTCVS